MQGLRGYVLRRLVLLLFVIVSVLTILFVMFKLLPGNPLSVFIDSNFPEEMIQRQKRLWGLDDPIWVQYLRYMWNMLTFNFGTSFFQMTPVRGIVIEKLLHTGAMIVPAVVLSSDMYPPRANVSPQDYTKYQIHRANSLLADTLWAENVIVGGSGHNMMLYQPQAVGAEIVEIVDKTRSGVTPR